ncbi:MAG: alpha/beta fold hydrolase, partial [Actinobacteria bacterium]|nr:alpha/beta fold hydrolase [Actinomycetota bacterium]
MMGRSFGKVATWTLATFTCLPLFVLPAHAAASDSMLPGGPTSATDPTPVMLEYTLTLPEQTPAPAVLLAHGFGGSKESLADQAQQLADRGYVVLTYSARGFGRSSGQISVNSLDFEVADASALIDYLGTRAEVVQDAPGDPRVGVAGGS